MTLQDSGSVEEIVVSTSRSKRHKRNQACQAVFAVKKSVGSQASFAVQHTDTQTGGVESSNSALDQMDILGLLQSLQRMGCRAEAALIDNTDVEADIFLVPEGFDRLDDGNVEPLYTLRPTGDDWNNDESTLNPRSGARPSFGSLICTSLSWNATGFILAAGYGRKDLVGWCDHPGALCTWNIGQKEAYCCAPTNTIKLDNCLMCIAFHPKQPTLIAGGTYNGEVYLWDLSRDDPQVAVSSATHVSHSEPITQVAWYLHRPEDIVHGAAKAVYQIISISTDGQLLVWSATSLDQPLYGHMTASIFCSNRYALLFPRFHSLKSKLQRWGGTSMSLASMVEDNSTLIVGCEGGNVFRCVLQHSQHSVDEFARQVKDSGILSNSWRTGKTEMPSPIKAQYEPHVGPVHSIMFSPFHKRIFVTCGYDGFVSIYSCLQAKPVLKLEPSNKYTLCASWSPFRPLVIAVGAGDGHLFLYDLQKSSLHPTTSVKASEKGEPISSVAFNHRQHQYLACSDGKRVKVYFLGLSYSKERVLERKQLGHLAQSVREDL